VGLIDRICRPEGLSRDERGGGVGEHLNSRQFFRGNHDPTPFSGTEYLPENFNAK
jgi:hypothetical protein